MNEQYIDVRNVSLVYETADGKQVHALDQVSFSVPEKSVIALVGPSGSGKSTLLKLIAGLLQPVAGQITVAGRPVREALERKAFGFVFQDAALLPWRNVLQNVTLLPELSGIRTAREREEKARALLDLVGLSGFHHHRPGELSGGMRQRVSIARALALDPSILLMDEPFGALDAIIRTRMNLELLRIWEQTHKTIVLVTHSIDEAVFVADRVLVFSPRPGRIVGNIPIHLPRPRQAHIQRSPAFLEYVDQITALLDGVMTDV